MATREKLEAAELKVKQIKAALQLKEAKLKAANSKKERANDTRRKILIGAFVLSQIEQPYLGMVNGKDFKNWLTRDEDKKLFEVKA